MGTDQATTEIAQADWDAVTAEDDTSAVSLSGTGEPPGGTGFPAEDEPPAAAATQAQPAAAAAAAAEPAPSETPVDPYAGVPEPVRAALARIPSLEHELRSAVGRVGALQREMAQAQHRPAPQADPHLTGKLAQLREELPEVADAIQEAMGHRSQPQTVDIDGMRQELYAQFQEDMLDSQRETWAKDLTSPAFNAWLDLQGPDYAQNIRTATKATHILGALSKFDKHMEGVNRQAEASAARGRRLANAVTPQAGARRTPNKSDGDMTADELWDDVTR